MVTLPLRKGVAFARLVAGGDLSQSLEVKSGDEAGELANALNSMVTGLKDMVRKSNIRPDRLLRQPARSPPICCNLRPMFPGIGG
jgi:methyl-accepting chemotaxis protein